MLFTCLLRNARFIRHFKTSQQCSRRGKCSRVTEFRSGAKEFLVIRYLLTGKSPDNALVAGMDQHSAILRHDIQNNVIIFQKKVETDQQNTITQNVRNKVERCLLSI